MGPYGEIEVPYVTSTIAAALYDSKLYYLNREGVLLLVSSL